MRILLWTSVACFLLSASSFADTIVPQYQVTAADATWTHTGGGVYTVPASAEDHPNEIWERNVEAEKWTSDGTTYTTNGKYYAYGDLKQAAWGVGSSDDMDFLFVQWMTVGNFIDDGGSISTVGLKGHYYFYFDVAATDKHALGINIDDGTGLGTSFEGAGSIAGKVTWFDDPDNDVAGSGITVTGEGAGGDGAQSFDNSTVAGLSRRNDATFSVEAAIKLSDLGLTKADFSSPLNYVYAGIAVSNPSGINSDIFANDFYGPEIINNTAEYDTLRLATSIPEPAMALLWAVAGCVGLIQRRK